MMNPGSTRKRIKKYSIAVFLLLFASSCLKSQVTEVVNHFPDTELEAKQKSLIYESIDVYPNQTQFSIAFIKNGEVDFYGFLKQNDSTDNLNNHQYVFEIGSISKVFTSTLLANMVIEGKLQLDDPVNNYIEITLKDDIQISFLQLANHTSGLPRMPLNFASSALLDPGNPFKNYDEEKLEEYITDQLTLNQSPGEKYEYSNLGAGFLGFVLCEIENKDYQSLLTEKVFSKYGMQHSTTFREDILDELVKGLNDRGDEVSNWDLASLVGAGGILATVEDLSKFALAQFDPGNKELALTRKSTFSVNDRMDIGMGWHIIKTESGNSLHWHNGGTGGYRSSMAIDVGKKNAVIILTNVSAYNKNSGNIDDLCFELMKTL